MRRRRSPRFFPVSLFTGFTKADSCLHDTGFGAPGNCSSSNVGSVATRC
jgi:hypothetical protein